MSPLSLLLLSKNAFTCSRINYCNSILIGLPKVILSQTIPLQTALNAAARLIALLPRWSHISSCMFDHLHLFPLTAKIRLTILTLVLRPSSSVTFSVCRSQLPLRPLRSLDCMIFMSREQGLLWLKAEPLLALARDSGISFLHWHVLFYYLAAQVSLSAVFKPLSCHWVLRAGSASDWWALWEALYKYTFNTLHAHMHKCRQKQNYLVQNCKKFLLASLQPLYLHWHS